MGCGAWIAGALVAACAGGAALGNVVINPGFETGGLAPWTGVPNPDAGATVVQSAVAHSGTMAAQFTSLSRGLSGSTIVFQSFPTLPQVGTFSFWYRFDATAAASMRLDLALEGGGGFFSVPAGPVDTWVQYVASGPILLSPNRSGVRIYAITTFGGAMPAGAHIWIDDVDVAGVPGPGSAIVFAGGLVVAGRRRGVARGAR